MALCLSGSPDLKRTKKGGISMMEQKNTNPSIACTVNSCAHHCKEKNHCTLNAIRVGCCQSKVTDCGSTECASFQLGAGN